MNRQVLWFKIRVDAISVPSKFGPDDTQKQRLFELNYEFELESTPKDWYPRDDKGVSNERNPSGSDQLCLPGPMFSSTYVSKDLVSQYLVSQYLCFSGPCFSVPTVSSTYICHYLFPSIYISEDPVSRCLYFQYLRSKGPVFQSLCFPVFQYLCFPVPLVPKIPVS